MKTLSLILTILISLNVYSQDTIDLANFFPSKFYWLKMDTNKVKSYLGKSFNDFRVKHGKSKVVINDSLSKKCEQYAKKLSDKFFKHATEKERGNSMECIGIASYFANHYINHRNEPYVVNDKTVDVNKMVADLMFEVFLPSKAHMEALLGNYKTYGIGVKFVDGSYIIVVRGY
jgi:uncharacterized protein YkwD